MAETVQLIVVRIPGVRLGRDALSSLLQTGAGRACDSKPPAALTGLRRDIHVCQAVDQMETYVYVPVAQGEESAHEQAMRLAQAGARHWPGTDALAYEVMQRLAGASAGRPAYWHYVVETDVLPSAEQDFNDWYASEHLPGLANVPGTVLAMRLRNLSVTPRYHALYLLESRETFGSEPWLAVRATPWSDRVRPNFRNTKRAMFTIQSS